MTQSFLDISGAVTQFATSATFSAVAPTFLSNISLPLSPTFSNPLQVWPVNDKTQSIAVTDPNFKPTVVQNYNASLERQLTASLSLAIRYVGNRTTHLPGRLSHEHRQCFSKTDSRPQPPSPRRVGMRPCSTSFSTESTFPGHRHRQWHDAHRLPGAAAVHGHVQLFCRQQRRRSSRLLQYQSGVGAGRDHSGPRLAAWERRLAVELCRGQSTVSPA